jgi:cytochrome c553
MKSSILCAIGAGLLGLAMATGAAEVQANWDKHCVKCHAKDGQGNTRMGRQSGAKDYTNPKVQAELTDEKAFKAIKEGIADKGKEKMKAYGAELSDEEIKALIAHVRTFKK